MFQLLQQEEELRQCQWERDQAALREKALEKRFHDLEVEAEAKASAKEDKSRHIKLMEVRNDVSVSGTG